MKYQGSCQCGRVRVGILSEPFLKYNCHCSHCRAFASKYNDTIIADDGTDKSSMNHNPTNGGAPYHSGVFVWRWSVVLLEEEDERGRDEAIEYEYSSSLGGLFGLARGRCSNCKQPIWERGRILAAPYAMVMVPPLRNVVPDTNIFYNSGYQKDTTAGVRRTIYTDFGSWMFEIWIVLSVAIPQLPSSIFEYLISKKNLPRVHGKEN